MAKLTADKKPVTREEVLAQIEESCLKSKILFLYFQIAANADCDCDNCTTATAVYKEEIAKAQALYEKPEGKLN